MIEKSKVKIRKLISSNAPTLMISLPIEFVKQNNLEKGQEMVIVYRGSVCTIIAIPSINYVNLLDKIFSQEVKK